MPVRHLPFAPLSFLAATLLLSGCAGLSAADRQAAGPAPGGASEPPATNEAGARAGGPQRRIEGPSPDSLVGSDGAGILKLVGAPGLVRRERGVEVWQYTDDTCVLLLYFYDDTDGARKLTYLEALAKAGADAAGAVSPAGCLSDQIHAFRAKDLG
jgi:hypothetical protein